MIPMDLQLFAEPADPDGAEQTPEALETVEPTALPENEDTRIHMTPEELEAKIVQAKSQADRTALDRYLKKLGTDKKTLEGLISTHKATSVAKEASPEEAPDNSLLEELEAEKTRSTDLERRVAAMSKGIPADHVDRYVRLAGVMMTDEVDFNAAIDAAVAEYPLPRNSVPQIVIGATNTQTEKPKYVPPRVL